MATTKTATLTSRIGLGLTAAEREHRSITNRVEVMILEYCGRADAKIEYLVKSVNTTQLT